MNVCVRTCVRLMKERTLKEHWLGLRTTEALVLLAFCFLLVWEWASRAVCRTLAPAQSVTCLSFSKDLCRPLFFSKAKLWISLAMKQWWRKSALRKLPSCPHSLLRCLYPGESGLGRGSRSVHEDSNSPEMCGSLNNGAVKPTNHGSENKKRSWKTDGGHERLVS